MDPAAKPSGVPFSQAKEDETGMFQETNCVVGLVRPGIDLRLVDGEALAAGGEQPGPAGVGAVRRSRGRRCQGRAGQQQDEEEHSEKAAEGVHGGVS